MCGVGRKVFNFVVTMTFLHSANKNFVENKMCIICSFETNIATLVQNGSDASRNFSANLWFPFLQFYNSKNTIMFDDLRRNFVMNPQNGLTIRPFRKAHANRDSDQELVKLTQYLLAIADLDDISGLDHKNWEVYNEANSKRRRHAWLLMNDVLLLRYASFDIGQLPAEFILNDIFGLIVWN